MFAIEQRHVCSGITGKVDFQTFISTTSYESKLLNWLLFYIFTERDLLFVYDARPTSQN
jgi:hypothetical protein